MQVGFQPCEQVGRRGPKDPGAGEHPQVQRANRLTPVVVALHETALLPPRELDTCVGHAERFQHNCANEACVVDAGAHAQSVPEQAVAEIAVDEWRIRFSSEAAMFQKGVELDAS